MNELIRQFTANYKCYNSPEPFYHPWEQDEDDEWQKEYILNSLAQ